jgi:hypothetical protein
VAPVPGRDDARGLCGEFSNDVGRPLHRRGRQAGQGDGGEGELHRPRPDAPQARLCILGKSLSLEPCFYLHPYFFISTCPFVHS